MLGGPDTPGGAGTWWGSYSGLGFATVDSSSGSPNAYCGTASGDSVYVTGRGRFTLSGSESEYLMIVRAKAGGPVELWQNGYLRGTSLTEINETANRVGAWVASQSGATPALKPGGLAQTLVEIG